MAAQFDLELVWQEKSQKLQVSWVEVQGLTGGFLIGPKHQPLVALLKPKSELVYQTPNGERKEINVFGGVVKVSPEGARVLLD